MPKQAARNDVSSRHSRSSMKPLVAMKRIHRVAVLGAGTMGARIAAHFANAGVPSYLLDVVAADSDTHTRNKIVAAGLEGAKKSKPAAFFEPELARLVTIGNFSD